MSTMQSTVRRIDAEQAYDGWVPGDVVPAEQAAAQRASLDDALQEVLAPDPLPDSSPLPSIAHLVVFHLREGESRSRRTHFPAIVMESDVETRRLKLWVIVDDGDTWMQEHVPARVGPEQGWVPVAQPEGPNELSLTVARLGDRIAALEHDIEVLSKGAGVPGELTTEVHESAAKIMMLEDKIAGMEAAIAEFGGRIDTVEDHPALEVPALRAPVVTAPAKRGPGRPKSKG